MTVLPSGHFVVSDEDIQRVEEELATRGQKCSSENARPRRAPMFEKHRLAGGLQTCLRYGRGWMRHIGRTGGRPTREEAACRAWEAYRVNKRHAGRHGH